MPQAYMKSSIYGDSSTVSVNLQLVIDLVNSFRQSAKKLRSSAQEWSRARFLVGSRTSMLVRCPLYPNLLPGLRFHPVISQPQSLPFPRSFPEANRHTNLPLDKIVSTCDANATLLEPLASHMSNLADRMTRAYTLYSHAEETSRAFMRMVIAGTTILSPPAALVGFGLMGGLSCVYHSLRKGEPWSPARIITDEAATHEGFMTGLAASLTAGGDVNKAAGLISGISQPLNYCIQGDKLTVTQVTPQSDLRKPSNISDCLANQERLASGSMGTSYGTIAIQRFTDETGRHRWLVTLPGTDGKADSPFGWPQNVELMSDEARKRWNADSARYVTAAMRQAGIGSTDPVVIVGHSQGGIIAATIAGDPVQEFRVEHIITAGSPIAGHPLPDHTWSTSIEVDDELVSSLDGRANQRGPRHLTVRGSSMDGPGRDREGTPVPGAGKGKELTHGMNYQRTAWKDAENLHNEEVKKHDEHFKETIRGTMDKEYYFQGRMGH